jgi:hypothetical protein
MSDAWPFLELCRRRQSVRRYDPARAVPRAVIERCLEVRDYTTISSGVLSVSSLADANSNSNLGAYATAGAAGISLNGGTLQYTGSDMTTAINRGFTLAATSTVRRMILTSTIRHISLI